MQKGWDNSEWILSIVVFKGLIIFVINPATIGHAEKAPGAQVRWSLIKCSFLWPDFWKSSFITFHLSKVSDTVDHHHLKNPSREMGFQLFVWNHPSTKNEKQGIEITH